MRLGDTVVVGVSAVGQRLVSKTCVRAKNGKT